MLKNYFSMGLFVLLVCQQKYLKLDKCFGVKSFVESVNGFNILSRKRNCSNKSFDLSVWRHR